MQITNGGIEIGPLTFSLFSLIVVAAVLIAVSITAARAQGRGHDSTIALDLGSSGLMVALIVGRIFYIITPPPSAAPYYTRDWYFSHPLDLLAGPVAIWTGGIGPAGAVLGALIGALIVVTIRGLDRWEWAEIALPGILAAAILLPWANLLQGQMLGPTTSLPWGIAANGARVQPTPAYLSLWALLVAGGMIIARRRVGAGWPEGTWSLVCGAALLVGMFLADFIRSDASRVAGGLSGMQILCILGEIALIALLWRRLRGTPDMTTRVTEFTEN